MGNSRYNDTAYRSWSTATTKTADGRAKDMREVFTQSVIHESLDPRKIVVRESVDSEANPNSRPIIIGLDVTGSMGYLANEMASTQMGDLMRDLIEKKTIEDPHLMFMGIGDVDYDRAPLQASQFEADLAIAEQLKLLYVESGGGGNMQESYTLPWYFAAFKTKVDCYDKRKVKGYLFTIGDEPCPTKLTSQQIAKVFGDASEKSWTTKDLYDVARGRWEIFHIIVKEGSYCRGDRLREVYNSFNQYLGNRTIILTDHKKLSEVIRAVIAVNEGASVSDVIAESGANKAVIEAAFAGPGEI